MKEREILFQRISEIKDYWVQTSADSLETVSDLIWSDYEEEYRILQNQLFTKESKQAFKNILDEVIKGTIHSLLVMLDGGDELTDKFRIDLINANTKISLKKGVSLNEEFISYLIDKE